MTELPDVQALSDAALAGLQAVVNHEIARRHTLLEAADQADSLASQYAQAAAEAPPRPWAEVGSAVGPGARVVWTDGNVWRNTSGAFLPSTAHPGSYPLGWAQETGLPEVIPAWDPDELFTQADVAQGVLREYNGVTYRLLQPINAVNPAWTPDIVPALWKAQS